MIIFLICSSITKASFFEKISKKYYYSFEILIKAFFYFKNATWIELLLITFTICKNWIFIPVNIAYKLAKNTAKIFDSLFNDILANFCLLISSTSLVVSRVFVAI